MKKRIALFLLVPALIAGCADSTTEPGEQDPIRISSPSNNATISEPLFVTAAAGQGYTFNRVDFYIDGDSVWTDTDSPYRYYWNVFQYTGTTSHTIAATGYTADSSFTSDTVNVTVSLTSGFAFLSTYVPNAQAAYGIVNYQNALFAAVGPDGTEVLDVSSRISPQYVSRYDSPGQTLKADVSFPYVFIADRDAGAMRLDFSNVSSLVLTGWFDTPGLANDVAVSGNYLYVADQDALGIADISQPDTIIALNPVSLTLGEVNYVVARGDTAYVTDNTNFYMIDLTDPYSPDIVATVSTPGQAQSVAVVDTFVFVADGTEGLISLSINNPSSPLSTYGFQQAVSSVDVGDSTLFAGTFGGGIFAFDFSQPDTLQVVDQFGSQDLIYQVHSDPPYLYVAGSGGVTILRFFP
jgi:hypothetical protein